MAPPEGSKQRKHRPRFKKATSSGKSALLCPGKSPAVPSQIVGPELPKVESLTAKHPQPCAVPVGSQPSVAPEAGNSQVLSQKIKPSQVSGTKKDLHRGHPQKDTCVVTLKQPELLKSGVPKASSPKKRAPGSSGSQKIKPSEESSIRTLELSELGASQIVSQEVRDVLAEAQIEVPSQNEKKNGLKEKLPQAITVLENIPVLSQSSSSDNSSLPICTTSFETCTNYVPSPTDIAPPFKEEVNSPLLFNVKEQNTLSETVGTTRADFILETGESNNTTMAQATNKLDSLCHLLENIVIQHTSKEAQSYSSIKFPDALAPQAIREVTPAKVSSTAVESPNMSLESREAIEHDRKIRKEAKKAKKKGGEKNKSEDGNESCKKEEKDRGAAQKQKSIPAVPGTEEKQPGGRQKPLQTKQQTRLPQGHQGSSQEGASGKSKADLKRERREKQEAQRQAKMVAKTQEKENQQKEPEQVHPSNDKTKPSQKKKKFGSEGGRRWRDKKNVDKGPTGRRIPLLGHLTPHSSQPPQLPVNCDTIHPAVRTLGLKMKERVVDGSTARVVSTLAALKRLINDYRTPESCDLSRDLAEKLLPNVDFLNACRSQAVAMDNAIRFLKHKINSIEPTMPEAQAKDQLRTAIDDYVQENIHLASSTIASHAMSLIQDGDIILTYGYSALVSDVVEAVCGEGRKVSVVVADSPHPASGAAMVKRLSSLGVPTYYRLITDVTHIMPKVTKVVVEAEAVMMNGAIQGMCGTAGLALAATTHDTPFIVLCYTYKFCNNDLTDSLVVNELGDVDSVVMCPSREYSGHLAEWRETQNLNVVSLVYDVTPASLVTVLVTEQSVLPTSAVPVIIRRNYADILGQD